MEKKEKQTGEKTEPRHRNKRDGKRESGRASQRKWDDEWRTHETQTRPTDVNRPEIGLYCNQLGWIESDISPDLKKNETRPGSMESTQQEEQNCRINICLPSISRHELGTSYYYYHTGLFNRFLFNIRCSVDVFRESRSRPGIALGVAGAAVSQLEHEQTYGESEWWAY